jgi:hypothetical protein
MRKYFRLFWVALIGLAGVVIVAIGVPLITSFGTYSSGQIDLEGAHWSVQVERLALGDRVVWSEIARPTGRPPTRTPLEVLPGWLGEESPRRGSLDGVRERRRVFVAFGVPFRMFWGESYGLTFSGGGASNVTHPSGAWAFPGAAPSAANVTTSARVIPIRPLWAGVVGNFAAYCILATLVRGVFRHFQAVRRSSKGRCPTCGYDRHGNFESPCPECGSTWANRSAA